MIRLILTALFVLGFFASNTLAEQPSDKLVTALIQHESRGDDHAIGDRKLVKKAYGCLQIRQPVLDDYNRQFGTNYRAEQCLGDRQFSVALCRWYIDTYATEARLGRKPTDEDKARIWNGGPSGCFENGSLDKNGRKPKTEKTRKRVVLIQSNATAYWQKKVRPLLENP